MKPTDLYCVNCRCSLRGLSAGKCPECGHSFDPDDDATFLTNPKRLHGIHVVVGFAILCSLIVWTVASSGDAAIFIDIPSLIWVIWILVGGLWMSFGPVAVIGAIRATVTGCRIIDRDTCSSHILIFARAYQLSWSAGLTGMLCGIVIMLQNMDDPSKIGVGMAVALLPLLYGAILAELIISPAQQALASRSVANASNLPLLAVPHRSIQGVALSVVFIVLTVILILVLSSTR